MTPRTKIIAASVLLLILGAAATFRGLDAATLARAVLAVAALGGMAWWFIRARGVQGVVEAPRMSVISRTGLNARTGIALVEVDGKTFLVVHGDGFAKVCRTTQPFKAALRSVS